MKRLRKPTDKIKIERILDANINRAKEGLRVAEDIARFALDARGLTRELKTVRHQIDAILMKVPRARGFIVHRRSCDDVGQHIYGNELSRKDIGHILDANMQRVKESLRVLEEFMKLESVHAAGAFKSMRYHVYEIEKKAARKSETLRHTR